MVRKQLRTKDYSEEARHRLGEAVEAARIEAGYPSRPKFCKAHGIKNLRGLELLEGGYPGVGQAFLFEVADALPGWTRDTPRHILEGGDPPAATPEQPSNATDADEEAPADDEGWTKEDQSIMDAIRAAAAEIGVPVTEAFTRAFLAGASWARETGIAEVRGAEREHATAVQ